MKSLEEGKVNKGGKNLPPTTPKPPKPMAASPNKVKMKITKFHGYRTPSGLNPVLIFYSDPPARLLWNRAHNSSPKGFEWGRSGGGAYALAKSILYEIDPVYAEKPWLIDAFKWQVIVLITDDEWTLSIEKIENFILRKIGNLKSHELTCACGSKEFKPLGRQTVPPGIHDNIKSSFWLVNCLQCGTTISCAEKEFERIVQNTKGS